MYNPITETVKNMQELTGTDGTQAVDLKFEIIGTDEKNFTLAFLEYQRHGCQIPADYLNIQPGVLVAQGWLQGLKSKFFINEESVQQLLLTEQRYSIDIENLSLNGKAADYTIVRL